MSRTAALRQQHADIAKILQALAPRLNPATVPADAAAIRSELATLAGKVNIHLAMEDKTLYPSLLNSSDPEAKRLATEFIDEMGGLAGTFKGFIAAWPTPAAVAAKPQEFCAQAKTVAGALTQRVEREERILYAAADRL